MRYFYLSQAPAPVSPLAGGDFASTLFDDLSTRIRSATGADPDDPVGVFGRSVRLNEASSRRIGRELAACKVLVPLYSPRYFVTAACGQVVSAFLHGTPNSTSAPVPVAPVLWIPPRRRWPSLPAPPVEAEDADRYIADGLLDVMMSRGDDPDAERCYHAVLDALSRKVLELAASAPIRLRRIDVIDHPNLFAREQPRPRIDLYVLAPVRGRLPAGRDGQQYGESCLDWNPFRNRAPEGLRTHMEKLAWNLGYRPVVRSYRDDGPVLLDGHRPPGPVVVVLDPWALEDPDWRAQLEAFDALDRPWIGIVAAWDPADEQTAAARPRLRHLLETTLERRFARRRLPLRMDADIAASLEDLGRAQAAVMQEAFFKYLQWPDDPPGPPPPPDP